MLGWNLYKYLVKTASIVVLYFVVLSYRPLNMVKPNALLKKWINVRFVLCAKFNIKVSTEYLLVHCQIVRQIFFRVFQDLLLCTSYNFRIKSVVSTSWILQVIYKQRPLKCIVHFRNNITQCMINKFNQNTMYNLPRFRSTLPKRLLIK